MNDSRKFMRGEIYYIYSFPTVGHEQRSGRPAVIVSNNENNANSGVLEVCYLTLKEKPKMPTHVMIDRGPCMNSTILCEQVTSVAVDKVGDYMCQIPEHLEEELDRALRVSLGLAPALVFDSATSEGDRDPESYKVENQSLKHENEHIYKELNCALKNLEKLEKELALTKEANNVIKEKAANNVKAVESANARADMFERLYNSLIDRLVGKN